MKSENWTKSIRKQKWLLIYFYDYFVEFVSGEILYINGCTVKDISFYPDGIGRIIKYEEKHIDITEIIGNREWSLQWDNDPYKWNESTYLDFSGDHSGSLKICFNKQNQLTQQPDSEADEDFNEFDALMLITNDLQRRHEIKLAELAKRPQLKQTYPFNPNARSNYSYDLN